MLQPIVYTPQVKPKKIEPKKSRLQMRAAGSIKDAGETEETFEAIGPGQPMSVGHLLSSDDFVPIEGAERKPHQPPGRLSEGTLKAMLQVQELDQVKIA
ncbi:hypothetical protein [Bradyrhizobium canariense]|nr:hypothetical protein [Bradyrhizobium canariense]